MQQSIPGMLLLAGLVGPGTALADDSWGDQLSRAVQDGKVGVDLRYRYEWVDEDGFDVEATLSAVEVLAFSLLDAAPTK